MPRGKPKKIRDQVIREMRAQHSAGSRQLTGDSVVSGPPAAAKNANPKHQKKLAELFAQLKKKYKGDVVTTIASGSRTDNVRALPSGWRDMDDLLTGETDVDARTVKGSGLGWPRGRIVEIYGKEGVGKTTLALHAIAAFQRAGETCAFVDAEHALDVSYARKLGVDLSTLQLSQPDSGGERALSVVHSLTKSGLFGCIVVDSVAALTPQSEMEHDGDFEKTQQPGRQGALMSRALRKLTSIVARNNVLLIFINQTRMKIGVSFGNPETTTGGNALKFYASVRLELTNMKTVRKGDRVVGRRTRVRAVKNKVAPPFRDVYCDVVPSKGITAVYGDPDFGGDGSED